MNAEFDAERVAEEAVRRAAEASSSASRPPLECVQLPHLGRQRIPPRPWAYGHYLLTGQAAVLGAVDGGGKGAMAVAIALAMITGRPLLGERVWRTGPVAIVSYEDDEDEWHRRIAAACEHYDADYDAALDAVHFITRPRDRIVFAAMLGSNPVYPDGDAIIAALVEIGAALLIVDPFNHAHAFEDGNSNVAVARVAAEMNRIAWQGGVAALVLHHLRKGSTGIVDDLMGATSLRATFRSTRILARMTPEEAKTLGVEHDVWRYSRIASSKENYAPPPDKAAWYRLESVPLCNGTDEYPEGDLIQVTATWQPAPLFEGIDDAALAAIFATIRTGLPDGEFFAPRRQAAKRWVGQVVVDQAGKAPESAARIVAQWLRNGVLVAEKYLSPKRREEAERVVLNEALVATIINPAGRNWGSAGNE